MSEVIFTTTSVAFFILLAHSINQLSETYMENQFAYWGIENYTRISAYDGREDDLSDIIRGRYPEMMTSGEIGCVTSHLKAIKHWMDTSDSPYAVIMEDDVCLDTVRFWNFSWNDFYSKVPYDWDTIQLAIICTDYIMVYDPNVPGFKFVNPKTYFGINNDYNPSPDIDDYGTY